MRNYIHIMLCVSLFMAQFVFIVGVDKTKNEVRGDHNMPIIVYILYIGSMLCCSCVIAVSVSSYIHVDVDGGCGIICDSCTSVHY